MDCQKSRYVRKQADPFRRFSRTINTILKYVWNVCMRLGSVNGELHNVKHGTNKEPKSLPYKLIMLINKNFNDLYEVNSFFAPINKANHINRFRSMLNEIAPFSTNEILVNGCFFSVEDRKIFVTETEYQS